MDLFWIVICAVALAWWLEMALEWAAASLAGASLGELDDPPGPLPSLSIIIPARDEARSIPAALPSVLAALPDGGEVILVDDRSTDGTADTALEAAKGDPRFRVVRVDELEQGWLGKNFALYRGYLESSGEYLLFTDADVVFRKGCLEKALGHCGRRGLDHLVATPRVVTRGFWERVFVPCFAILLMARYRIWRAPDPRSRYYAGIGAFNMVRREAYERAGTHAAMPGEVVDDLGLGRLIKGAGGRQGVVGGETCLSVRWNRGLGGLVSGLEKNAYAGLAFNPLKAVSACLGLLSLTLVPAAAPLAYAAWGSGGTPRWAAAAGLGVWACMAVLYGLNSRGTGARWIYFATFPAGSILLAYAVLRSAVMYHVRGGVQWRGTLYGKKQGPRSGDRNPSSRAGRRAK